MAVGFMAAAVSAYVSIVWLLSWIRRQSLGRSSSSIGLSSVW